MFVGKSMEELLATWKNEAMTALGVRHKGMDIELYKVVAERRVGTVNRVHSEKKWYRNGTPIAPKSTPFSKGHSFFLNNHVCEKKSALRDRGTIHKNSTPRGTICPISTPFRKGGTILVPFLPEGYCFEAKKG